ncbi:hypothetical protein PCE1_002328 [Barthelona sp. PCE]
MESSALLSENEILPTVERKPYIMTGLKVFVFGSIYVFTLLWIFVLNFVFEGPVEVAIKVFLSLVLVLPDIMAFRNFRRVQEENPDLDIRLSTSAPIFTDFFIIVLFLAGLWSEYLVEDDYNISIHWGVFVGFYAIALIINMCSKTAKYTCNQEEAGGSLDQLARIATYPIEIVFHVHAYHYETRWRTVSYTDSNGNTQTRQESYQECVTTLSLDEVCPILSCNDVTPASLLNPDVSLELLKIDLDFTISPASEQDNIHLQQKYNYFKDKYYNYDVFVDFNLKKRVIGKYSTSFLSYADPNALDNACISVPVMMAMTLTPWFASYTMNIDSNSAFVKIPYQKRFSFFHQLLPQTTLLVAPSVMHATMNNVPYQGSAI